ncbi:hypothetical protein TTRE_0000295301 [Trichuris trichiura]|uniref:Uncharacterized protein n=1 Tax=Trichuris trichiura TaxID=36087 RepID=A0A077Z4X7_TRITR|nr:hypothetical protein TTRE_0000295301 [Trichuris trichiura]
MTTLLLRMREQFDLNKVDKGETASNFLPTFFSNCATMGKRFRSPGRLAINASDTRQVKATLSRRVEQSLVTRSTVAKGRRNGKQKRTTAGAAGGDGGGSKVSCKEVEEK